MPTRPYKEDRAPPANWQDFEDLCLKLWRASLVDAKKNGRTGQPQAGVDIFGRDPKTNGWVGIQCKQKGQWPPKVLMIRQIKDEIRRAAKFKPPLSHFIITTTAQRDVKSQEFVRRLDYWRRKAGKFTVEILSWDDLQDRLQEESISREGGVQLTGIIDAGIIEGKSATGAKVSNVPPGTSSITGKVRFDTALNATVTGLEVGTGTAKGD